MACRSTFMIGSVAVAMALLVVAGCRSSTKQTAGEEPVGVETVGIDTCFNCHADGRLGKYPSMVGNSGESSPPYFGWLFGPHGNFVTPVNLDYAGSPSYTDFSDSTCQNCHDPLGDGKKFSVLYSLYGVDAIGRVDRPVVGCESCHGNGGNHWGIGPMPYPKPGPDRCGQCHNASFPTDHLEFHPEGSGIYEAYQSSPHARSINEHTYVTGSTTEVRILCSRCHTDDGVKLYHDRAPGTTGYANLVAFFTGLPDLTNPKPIECRTCHDVHNQGKSLLANSSTDTSANANPQSEQYNTCTTCHQLSKDDGTVMTDAYHDLSVNSRGSLDEVITDTHAAVPGDTRLNSGSAAVALIFVNKGDDRSCTGCHNPHNADTTINKQYARSGHGDATADAWTHYDWKGVSRQSCQQCHTSTGFKNFADALRAGTTYNPANNNFYGLLAGTSGNTGQLETIYCWGCHTDNKGGLRNPGPITAPYKDMSNNPIIFPDVSGSNVCMACHTGQQSGGTVYNSTGNFSNLSFINSHYLTGGATVFRASGYAYPTRDYTNVAFYEHDKIGSADASGTGTNGPCAGCHMQTAEPHLFLPVTKDETTGAITAITSTACVTCHTGQFELTATELEQERTRFQDALKALDKQLQLKGYYFDPTYPYFFTASYDPTYNESTANPHCQKNLAVKNWQTGGTSTFAWSGTSCTSAVNVPGTMGTGKPNMGAAFNYNLLEHDPGAFAHNRYYVKRLIYDSIDWLDDNNLNDSVQATLNALNPATDPYMDNAIAYILSATGGRP